MTLTVITFLWGDTFTARHVNGLKHQCRTHIKIPHRFVCITDKPAGLLCETYPLWPDLMQFPGRPGNFRRLRVFDRAIQKAIGGSRLALFDIDTVMLGDITDLLTGPEHFKILEGSMGRNGERLNEYNGSFWVCDSGLRPHFWDTFGPHAEWQLNDYRRPSGKPIVGSDQAWIALQSPGEATFTKSDGIRQYFSLARYKVPIGTRMVFFAGRHNPWDPRVRRTHPDLAATWFHHELKGNKEG